MATIEVPDDMVVDGKLMGKFTNFKDMAESMNNAQAKITEMGQKLGVIEPKLGITPAGGDPTDSGDKKTSVAAKIRHGFALLRAGNPKAREVLSEFLEESDIEYALELEVENQKQYVNNVYEAAGGEASYKEILQWASTSEKLSRYEKEAIHREITSGNPTRAINTVRDLRQRYREVEGYEAKDFLVTVPGSTAAERIEPFRDEDEMAIAFSDPKAIPGTSTFDAGYRKKIEARAGISSLEGVSRNTPE